MKARKRNKSVLLQFENDEVGWYEMTEKFTDLERSLIIEFRNNLRLAEYDEDEIEKTLKITVKNLYDISLYDKELFKKEIDLFYNENNRLYSKYYEKYVEKIEKERERERLRQDKIDEGDVWDDEAMIFRALRNGSGDLIGY